MNDDRRAVKQLDHLLVQVDNPQPLFELLSETLQLPIAWPLRSYPSFMSGGVTLGNLYLEILSFAAQPSSTFAGALQARFAAMAFEVDSLAQSL